jgi:hypothetical protein
VGGQVGAHALFFGGRGQHFFFFVAGRARGRRVVRAALTLERDIGEVDLLARQLLERGRAILQALVDHRLIPFAQREHAGSNAHERVLFVALLDERGQAGTHGHVRALAHVTQQVLLDGYVGDLFVVEGLAYEAQYLRRGFSKRH